MSNREKIIFLSEKNNENCEFQDKVITSENLWNKVKKVYISSQEGLGLAEKFKISFMPTFILRNDKVVKGPIGSGSLREKLDLRKFRGK